MNKINSTTGLIAAVFVGTTILFSPVQANVVRMIFTGSKVFVGVSLFVGGSGFSALFYSVGKDQLKENENKIKTKKLMFDKKFSKLKIKSPHLYYTRLENDLRKNKDNMIEQKKNACFSTATFAAISVCGLIILSRQKVFSKFREFWRRKV